LQLALFDPQNKLSPQLEQSGVKFTTLNDLQTWDGVGILVLGPGALSQPDSNPDVPVIGAESAIGAWLNEKVQAGGRVLVLEQDSKMPVGTLPVKLSAQQSTLAFIQAPNHPILAGLTDADMRWWRGDNLVSVAEPARPNQAGMQSLVVTGDQAGISHAPLIEVRQGKGVWILCQLLVASKLQTEPVAQLLFERMLKYLASFSALDGAVLYYPAEMDLRPLKADLKPLENWGTLQFPATRELILRGSAKNIPLPKVQAFLDAGGTVLWDRPESDANPFLQAAGTKLQLEPWQGTVSRGEGNSTWFDFLTREDLYWLGAPGKNPESETALAPNAATILAPEGGSLSTQDAIPASKEALLEGDYVKPQGSEIVMATNGSVAWTVTLAEDKPYQFVLLAYGTPLKKVYPLAQITLDKTPIGTLSIDSQTLQTYRLLFNGKAGQHRLAVSFINDEYAPPEDRNLTLSAYLVLPVENIAGMEIMTNPAALVSLPIGTGKLLISTIAWDAARQNNLRGQRYFADLLGGSGVLYAGGQTAVTVEAEALKPMPNFTAFDASQGYVSMYTNGYVEGQIQIAQAGNYRIGLLGRGTPVNNIYPVIQVEINGRVIGKIELDGGGWEMHNLFVALPAGAFNLRLNFVNDDWNPATGEDRNAWLDQVEFELIK
jgi:hypothetical protein